MQVEFRERAAAPRVSRIQVIESGAAGSRNPRSVRRTRGATVASSLLRAVVGGTVIAHGVKHGRSVRGTAGWFASIGFRQPELQARASAVVEVGSGVALLAGACTPLAAAAVVGTMAVAARSVHFRNGFFITAEGYEYVLNLAAASVALAALGPGQYSVDARLGLDRFDGRRGAAIAFGVGVGAAAVQLAAFWRRPRPTPVEARAADEQPVGEAR